LGYDDAHTVIERRFTESRQDLLETYSNELAGLDLDVLVVVSAPALFYVRQWRNEVPIVAVMPLVDDVAAIGAGYSLARPGANITGLIGSVPGLWGKRFELLQEVVPRTSRVALLWNSLPQEVANTDELEQAFEAAVAARADALAWFATVLISDDHARIARLALESGLASISDQRQFVNAGGLMAYSGDLSDWPQRTAALVDRVLKGQKPAEIAIEGPSRFILSVNLGTARALGIKFPQSVLLRATEVIQ
jgi:putative ABC transport system substrate-binding protein